MSNTSNHQNGILSNIVKILSALAVVAMLAVSIVVYKAHVQSVCIFIAYIIFYVQLPGLFIIRLAGIKPKHASAEIVIGLFTGWSLMMLLYFITDYIKTDILLLTIGPALSAAYLLVCSFSWMRNTAGRKKASGGNGPEVSSIKTRNELMMQRLDLRRLPASWCLFFAMSLLFILLAFPILFPTPPASTAPYII